MSWGGFYTYTTVAELKEKARKSLSSKAGKAWHPITVDSRNIAKSWWGKAWCDNLESYADYDNRIGRGRSYVRAGLILDLQIDKGKVHAIVQGSRAKPYQVEVDITPLTHKECEGLVQQCTGKAASLDALLGGSFPEEMKALFFKKGGLFPSPEEIHFSCSCPDWASMCKHVAAVLYGIAAKFDEDPMLFFKLRGVNVNDFIDESLAGYAEKLLSHAQEGSHSKRIINDEKELSKLFGIL